MIAAIVHLTDVSRAAELVLLVFILLLLIGAAIAMYREDRSERDEEDLADYYGSRRRLPL